MKVETDVKAGGAIWGNDRGNHNETIVAMKVETDVKAGGAIWGDNGRNHSETIVG